MSKFKVSMGISWTTTFSTLSTFSLMSKCNPRCQSQEQVLSGLSRWCCPRMQTQWTLPPDASSSLLTLGETENAESAFFPLYGQALAWFLWSPQPVRSLKSWSFICATWPLWHKKQKTILSFPPPPTTCLSSPSISVVIVPSPLFCWTDCQ